MADLITSARAKQNINQSTFSSAENDVIAALVTAASRAVRRYCKREFDSQTFDELYGGRGDARLILDQYPILSVARVAGGPRTVLTIRNTASANQRATVAVTATGLTLVRVASGVTSSDTSVTWAGNVTLQAVRDAVNGLGNGWSASLPDSTYALRASADLRALQGALNAKDMDAGLVLHVEEVSAFAVDVPRGWLVRMDRGTWVEGVGNYRIVYTAGYDTVPEDVQEATAQWVAALYWQTKDNPATYPDLPTAGVAALLAPYRKHGV
jgi:hypothetical protein